jgi:hypothetical protein
VVTYGAAGRVLACNWMFASSRADTERITWPAKAGQRDGRTWTLIRLFEGGGEDRSGTQTRPLAGLRHTCDDGTTSGSPRVTRRPLGRRGPQSSSPLMIGVSSGFSPDDTFDHVDGEYLGVGMDGGVMCGGEVELSLTFSRWTR